MCLYSSLPGNYSTNADVTGLYSLQQRVYSQRGGGGGWLRGG